MGFKICKTKCFLTADGSKLAAEDTAEANTLFAVPGKRLNETALEGIEGAGTFFVDEAKYAPEVPKEPSGDPPKSMVTITKVDPPEDPKGKGKK